jgi:hypothetical protein
MVLDIVKVAAVIVIVVGVGVLVVTFIRKSRANGFPTYESNSHYAQMRGAMPPTPKPEWVDWEDEESSTDGSGDRR